MEKYFKFSESGRRFVLSSSKKIGFSLFALMIGEVMLPKEKYRSEFGIVLINAPSMILTIFVFACGEFPATLRISAVQTIFSHSLDFNLTPILSRSKMPKTVAKKKLM
jgi:hypothetical protein